MRRCPRCTWLLTSYQADGVELDRCERCSGTLLDPGESRSLTGGIVDPAAWVSEHFATELGPSKLKCPTGHADLVEYRLAFDAQSVKVDVCPRCRGLWLDKDEGAQLQAITKAAQQHAVDKESGASRPSAKHYVFQLVTGFPAEVWNPVKNKPVLIYTLVAVLIAAYLAQIVATKTIGSVWGPYLLCIPSAIVRGERVWTLLTCGFLHGGFSHILGNLYFLWIFGDNVEDVLGKARFALLYLACLLGGSAAHVFFNQGSSIPMLGASGAVAGLMGAYIMLFPRVKMWVVFLFIRFKIGVLWYLGFWIGMQFLIGLDQDGGVAWWAHLGGFAVGAALTPFLRTNEQIELAPQAA